MQEDNKFRIGEFVFDTFHEYRDGQEDLKKIECINKELNIHDPKVAVRLYNMIRAGEIVFKSPIGDKFYAHLADIVADKSVGLLEVKDDVEEAESKVKKEKIIGIAIVGLAIIFFAYFGISEIVDYVQTRKMAELQAEKVASEANKTSENTNKKQKNTENTKVDPSTLTVLPEYQDLVAQNPDFVGWITIGDTKINYPVVQKAGDNEYYLTHTFDNSEDSAGSVFMDYRCDVANPTTNTILYGHNMKNGTVFGELKKYLDLDFYNNHKIITFDTKYAKGQYEVVAVCLSEVGYQDDNNFKYYNFVNAENDEAQVSAFISTIANLSVHGSDINVNKDDKLLTLSTCNSYTEDGRLFIVAKKVN